MAPKVGTLSIQRYRAFRQLEIQGLGRVNLITGRNNTGKSSVLEALRILASSASMSVIYDILRFREENTRDTEVWAQSVSSLFHGFPEFGAGIEPVTITSTGGQRPMELSVSVGLFSEERQADGVRRLVPQQLELFDEREAVPAMVIETGGGRRVVRLIDVMARESFSSARRRSEIVDEPRLPCHFVSAYGGEKTATLGSLWDAIALSNSEQDVVEALRIIDPMISAVSMVGGQSAGYPRTAIVRASALPRPVPLRSFGDGLNRLFGIALSLVNARDGLLLIDEFENGLHHTVQVDVWRAIFKLASRLDVQVVATSHSWDAVESFQKAANEDPEAGVLIRLSRKGDNVIPTVFTEQELAIIARDHIEVR